MIKKLQKIAVLTSGGDAPGMNAAIRAVVRSCAYHNIACVGVFRGLQGLIEGDFKDLDARSVKNIINRGGTFLKTARSKDFFEKEGRAKAHQNLLNEGVDALIVIGGDGTFTGASIFIKEFNFPIVGLPGTIDNDIHGTDFTIGYDTALNTVVEAIDKIRDTANSHNRLFLVEVMGRDAGHIALNAGIGAGAEEILIPEENMGKDRLIESLERSKKSGKTSSIIVVSEGDQIGKNIFELADFIQNNLEGYDVRVTVLGHIQRGGSPSCYDRVLASRMGVAAVDALMEGSRDVMIGIVHNKMMQVPFEEAIKDKQKIDAELIRVADITSI
ncbi:MAG: 6-phosphofructokinase [Flavobacteriaceae bacterium CG_4_8_14_3_um_filter_34_10]|nr:6-phosphofructokinase [Flavobacteriia bacterium]OIP52031.1 MAG: 6-phosphofructokinase [Flavobacteriaceae bacterium CG2_30_34_30]PIQ17472.1 MAG: 6-phosphofructokinase [Flavobacteriaceae bacterium CG18_big_fil_WC_8_21_14_2_50_34_36]PIV49146.1 MAG: 6-phosphofructokinase [Flavobacteriaceae bacterium CG02_land_8_20_14_3_00_34_13]PIX09808.1 MAG: 6-phosphofructokinase [Flavobacteriaceae bacterium CG_4_8_14_3_um_filter_34_10]PIZ07174.1 MAG: 6-phosphofructokinase [Flavobacteriaceae bacterium CG_4_10